MTRKHISLLLMLSVFFTVSKAQQLKSINVRAGNSGNQLAVVIGVKDMTVRINKTGSVSLQNNTDDFGPVGIGNNITHYDNFDGRELLGKIKSIGDITFTYYGAFDRSELRGKIKAIGNLSFTYYDGFDNDELRGKLKSAAGNTFTYYDSFGPGALKGFVKTVGSATLIYYGDFAIDALKVKEVQGSNRYLKIIGR